MSETGSFNLHWFIQHNKHTYEVATSLFKMKKLKLMVIQLITNTDLNLSQMQKHLLLLLCFSSLLNQADGEEACVA